MNNTKEKMTWTIVKFPNEDSVEAVPTAWIYGNKCFWPPFVKPKVRTAIEQGISPDVKTWELHDVSFFKNSVFDEYSIAKKKSGTATFTSDLDSQSDTPIYVSSKKRKIFKKTYSFSSVEDEEEVISGLPPPPALQTDSDNQQVEEMQVSQDLMLYSGASRLVQSSSQNPLADFSTQNAMPGPSNYSTTCHTEKRAGASGLSLIDLSTQNATYLTPCRIDSRTNLNISATPRSLKSNIPDNDDETTKYLKMILRKQNILQGMISELMQQVSEMKQNKRTAALTEDEEVESLFTKFQLPINCEEDLQIFENALENQADFNKAVLEISSLGGKNIYDFIYRSTQKLVTNNFSSGFSWLGRKGKRIFKELTLTKLLISAALTTVDCTVNDAETTIQKWLKRSTDRAKNENKKK